MGFFQKKRRVPKEFDRDTLRPVIRCSICTGEETAGFQDRNTGKFHEDRLLRTQEDLALFMEEYGLTEVPPRIY